MRWTPRRFPRVRQHDQSDCGAACLDAIARYHGLSVSLARIRHLASTDASGTNLLGMVEAAKNLGFIAKAARAPADALPKLPTPFIAHLVLPSGLQHYVVVTGASAGTVRMMDPADGRLARVGNEAFGQQWTGVLILLAPGESFRAVREKTSPVRRFASLLRPHRRLLLQALLGAAIYTLLGLSTAIYVEKIVDHVLVGGNQNLLNLLSVGMLGILAIQLYVGSARSFITLRTGQHIDAALILGYYEHLLSLPQSFFDTMRTGELISRVGDAVKIRAFINDVAVDLLVSAMIVILASMLMLIYNVQLGLVVICIIPLFLIVYLAADRVHKGVLRTLMQSAAELESNLIESINGVSTVKRFGLESALSDRMESSFVRLLRSVYSSGRVAIHSGTGAEGLSRLTIIAALWVGSGYVLSGELSPGELMSFYALIGYFTGPATRLVTANRSIQDALIAADRLFEIMDIAGEDPGGSVIPTAGSRPALEFEKVTVRYGSGSPVLRELTLKVNPGSVAAIVGESGCGKSTLLSLPHCLYPVAAGHVRIGGYDVQLLDRDWLRRHVAVVPQTIHLFTGNVLENIAVGEPSPDMVRLLAIADRLGISDFVESMPQGFHTRIGENGALLSGGQRQRIALARALYLEPEILLLDEATSSLDALSESLVKRTLSGFAAEGRTVVMVAHRLASVTGADQIVVLDGGAVSDSGTHGQLLSRGGLYRRLWDAQNPVVGETSREGAAEFALV